MSGRLCIYNFLVSFLSTDKKIKEATKKSPKYSLMMMILLSLSSFSINTVESKEEARAQSALSQEQDKWQEKRFVASVDADGIQRVERVGGDYYYDPNYIVVR